MNGLEALIAGSGLYGVQRTDFKLFDFSSPLFSLNREAEYHLLQLPAALSPHGEA